MFSSHNIPTGVSI